MRRTQPTTSTRSVQTETSAVSAGLHMTVGHQLKKAGGQVTISSKHAGNNVSLEAEVRVSDNCVEWCSMECDVDSCYPNAPSTIPYWEGQWSGQSKANDCLFSFLCKPLYNKPAARSQDGSTFTWALWAHSFFACSIFSPFYCHLHVF